ncbi:hypothetical protein, partial [Chromobacterium piscinae]|uniref:hypothetical protein n=1 Tax=Chromobacterium piscinae TaxID=686831 RepID=UPI003260D6BF
CRFGTIWMGRQAKSSNSLMKMRAASFAAARAAPGRQTCRLWPNRRENLALRGFQALAHFVL